MASHEQKRESTVEFDDAVRKILNAGHIPQERGKKTTSKPPTKKTAK